MVSENCVRCVIDPDHKGPCNGYTTSVDRPGRDILFLVHKREPRVPEKVVTVIADDREDAKRRARTVLGGNDDLYVVSPLTAPGTEVFSA